MNTIKICTKQDMSKFTRWCDSHRDIKWHTTPGEYGTIIVTLDNGVYA